MPEGMRRALAWLSVARRAKALSDTLGKANAVPQFRHAGAKRLCRWSARGAYFAMQRGDDSLLATSPPREGRRRVEANPVCTPQKQRFHGVGVLRRHRHVQGVGGALRLETRARRREAVALEEGADGPPSVAPRALERPTSLAAGHRRHPRPPEEQRPCPRCVDGRRLRGVA